jgi:hypothetical protein
VKQLKPQIRLPDDEGPNPFDSKTGLQPKPWMRWQYWIGALALGLGAFLVKRYLG